MEKKKLQAFTLIELAIVLVIIGLLVGGILVGNDLIRAAERRSTVAQLQTFIAATNAFRTKYDCLPGDCLKATQFFGQAPDDCGAGVMITSPRTVTCNGDGDGYIGNRLCNAGGYQCDVISNGTYAENWAFWQQLGNAELLAERYTGVAYTNLYGPHGVLPGGNVPMSRLKVHGVPAGYDGYGTLVWMVWSGTTFWPSGVGVPANTLTLGGYFQNISGGWATPVSVGMAVEAAFDIDTKLDDGNGMTGKIRSTNWPACFDGSGIYQVSSPSTYGCSINYLNAF